MQLIESSLKHDSFDRATHGGNTLLKAALHIFVDMMRIKTE
jgi:hypothetical protein